MNTLMRKMPALIAAFLDYLNVIISWIIFPILIIKKDVFMLSTPSMRVLCVGLVLATFYVGQFLGTVIFGTYSDSYGRKKGLFITQLGTCAGYLLTALAIDVSILPFLFISRLVSGLFAANITIAQSSLVDEDNGDSKAGSLSLVEVAIGFGFMTGGILGGIFSDITLFPWFFMSLPFWILGLVTLLNVILLSVFFVETRVIQTEAKFSLRSQFKGIHDVVYSRSLKRLCIIWMIFIVGWNSYTQFFSTFLVKRYTFTSSQVGLMFIVGGITYILTQLFVVMPFSKFFEPSKIIRVTMLLMALPSLSVFVFEDLRYLSVFLIVYIMSLAVTFPNLLALISNNVSAEKQGNIIGLLWSSQALVTVIGTFVGGFLAAYNIYSPIIIGGSFLFASWLLFLYSFAAKSPSA